MDKKAPHVVAIGYAKRALEPGSREYIRMAAYASVFGAYHLIVFTRVEENFPAVQQEGNLFLYATNSRTRVGMLLSAYLIARKIIKSKKNVVWVVSGQDPLTTSLVTVPLSWIKNTALHVQCHGDVFNMYFFGNGRWKGLKLWWANYVIRRAKKIRVVSQRIKQSFIQRDVPADRIVVLPIQGDLEPFLSVGDSRVYQQKTAPTFLYVGRLAPEKNIPLLLEACADLKKRGHRAVLQILGSGPENLSLQTKVNELHLEDNIEFLPWTNDVAGVMSQADVLCLSSFHEGFAMVLVEAMAAGLPVITTDVGCAGEIVKDHIHGFVVSGVQQYTDALEQLFDNALREKMGRAGHTSITKSQLSASEYLQAIKQSFTI